MSTKSKAILALVITLALNSATHAQRKEPNPTAFRTSMLDLQKETAGWEQAVAKVNVEELPVSYAEGKTIDQQLSLAEHNLRLIAGLSTRILKSGRLSDEINLMETLNEVGRSFQEISNLLLSVNTNDDATGKKILALSQALTTAADGGINSSYLTTYSFVMGRARSIELENCSVEASR